MLFIKHRCNTISELKNTSKNNGVEIDIRSYKNNLILNHEPFEDGILLKDWLCFFVFKCLEKSVFRLVPKLQSSQVYFWSPFIYLI